MQYTGYIDEFNTSFLHCLERAGTAKDDATVLAMYREKLPGIDQELLLTQRPKKLVVAMDLAATRVKAHQTAVQQHNTNPNYYAPMEIDAASWGRRDQLPRQYNYQHGHPRHRQHSPRQRAFVPPLRWLQADGVNEQQYEERLRNGQCLLCGNNEHLYRNCGKLQSGKA